MDGWIQKHAAVRAIQSVTFGYSMEWWEHGARLIAHNAHVLSCAVSPLFGKKWDDDDDGRFSRDGRKALLADSLYAVFEQQKS